MKNSSRFLNTPAAAKHGDKDKHNLAPTLKPLTGSSKLPVNKTRYIRRLMVNNCPNIRRLDV